MVVVADLGRPRIHLRTQNSTHLGALIIFPAAHKHRTFIIVRCGVGWGGVGWDKNVHVPVHTHRHHVPKLESTVDL